MHRTDSFSHSGDEGNSALVVLFPISITEHSILPVTISLSSVAPTWLAETQAHTAHWVVNIAVKYHSSNQNLTDQHEE